MPGWISALLKNHEIHEFSWWIFHYSVTSSNYRREIRCSFFGREGTVFTLYSRKQNLSVSLALHVIRERHNFSAIQKFKRPASNIGQPEPKNIPGFSGFNKYRWSNHIVGFHVIFGSEALSSSKCPKTNQIWGPQVLMLPISDQSRSPGECGSCAGPPCSCPPLREKMYMRKFWGCWWHKFSLLWMYKILQKDPCSST